MSDCEVNPSFSYTRYPCDIDDQRPSDPKGLPVIIDLQTPVKAEIANRIRESILAIEGELGINPSSTYTTVKSRLDALEGIINGVLDEIGGLVVGDKEERFYGVSGDFSTKQSVGYQTIGAINLNSSSFVNASYYFESIIETTSSDNPAKIRLFNASTALEVSGTVLTSSSVSPSIVSCSFTPDPGQNIYLVQLMCSQTPSEEDFVSCKSSIIKVVL